MKLKEKLKSYRYRGWENIAYVAFLVLISIIVALFNHWESGLKGFLILMFTLSISHLLQFVSQRKLTAAQWKKQQAEKDERFQYARTKAWACSGLITTVLSGIFVCICAILEEESPAFYFLSAVFLAGGLTFSMALSVLRKKL